MDAEETSKRCVLFKNVPVDTSESSFRLWLDGVWNNELRNSYISVAPHKEDSDDIRWIVLFKYEKDAASCIDKKKVEVRTQKGEVLQITPDFCSECIVPDEWLKGPNDWVTIEPGKPYTSLMGSVLENSRLQSIQSEMTSIESDDLFGGENGNSKPTHQTTKVDDGGIPSGDLFGSGKDSRPSSAISSASSSALFGSGRYVKESHGFEPRESCEDASGTGKQEVEKVETSQEITKEVIGRSSSLKGTDEIVKSGNQTVDTKHSVERVSSEKVTRESPAYIKGKDTKSHPKSPVLEDSQTDVKDITAETRNRPTNQQQKGTKEIADEPNWKQENSDSSNIPQSQPNFPMYPQQPMPHGQFPNIPLYPGMAHPFMPYGYPSSGVYGSTEGTKPAYMPYPMMPFPLMMPQTSPSTQDQGQNIRYAWMPVAMPTTDQGAQMPQIYQGMQNLYSFGMMPDHYASTPNWEPNKPTQNKEDGKEPKYTEDDGDTYITPISSERKRPQFRGQMSTESVDRYGYSKETTEIVREGVLEDEAGYVLPLKRQNSASKDVNDEKIYASIDEMTLAGDTTIRRIEQRKSEKFDLPPNVPKRPPSMQKLAPSAENNSGLRIIDDHEENDVQDGVDESLKKKTIKIEGIPNDASPDLIELFIESEEISGRKAVVISTKVDPEKQEAIVVLETASSVETILEKQRNSCNGFLLKKQKVKINVYTPPPKDPRKVFISGMKAGTSDDNLQNFIEVCCGEPPTDIEAGLTPGTALLTFDTPPDLVTLERRLQERPLENQFLNMSEVEVSKSIKVKGYAPGDSHDALLYYFENTKRSGGGEVDTVEYQQENNVHLVHFLKEEDAISVCKKRDHEVSGTAITVSLYYPCMNLAPEFQVSIPEPLEIEHLDPYIARFLKVSSPYRLKLDIQMKKMCSASVIYPEDAESPLRIKCDVDPKDKRAHEKLADWDARCRAEVDSVCSHLDVNDQIVVAKEVWTGVCKRLKEIKFSAPDMVMVQIKREEFEIAVFGLREYVVQFSKTISEIVSELEQKLELEQQNITKSKVLRNYQTFLLRYVKFPEKASTSTLSVSMNEREIEFSGSKKEVDDCMDKMYQRLREFAKRSLQGYTKAAKDLLFQKETRNYIKKMMNKNKLLCVWDVVRGNDLVIYSKTERDLEEVERLFKKCLQQKKLVVDSSMGNMMRTKEWTSHLQQINANTDYTGLMTIEEKLGEIRIIAVDSVIQNIYDEVMKFFDLHGNIQEFMSIEPGRFLYIVRNKKRELEAIEKRHTSLNISIERVDKSSRKGFKIHGKKDGCRLVILRIQEIVDNVMYKDLKMSFPGLKEYLRSQNGKTELQNIEISHKCILLPEIGGGFERSISQTTDMPKEAASCKFGRCSVSVLEGDITRQNVDMIVNHTMSTLHHSMGLGSAIVDRGGYNIQTQCHEHVRSNGIMSDADVFVSKAGKLPCKWIAHVVIPTWTGGHQNERSVMRTAIEHCLAKAEKHDCKSIALPVLGTGTFRYPLDVAARTIVEIIWRYMTMSDTGRSTVIQQIYLCEKRSEGVQVFIDVLKTKLGSSDLHVYKDSDTSNSSGSSVGSGGSLEEDEGHPKVTVIEGELAKQTADVIVNSTNQNLDLRVGNVSRGLLKAGGDVIQQECTTKYPGGIRVGEIAKTGAGALNCRQIYHGMLQQWDLGQGPAETAMGTFIQRCLKEADNAKHASIAFPALGTGNLKFPPDVIARLMFVCVRNFPSDYLKEVKLVVWQGDYTVVKIFKDIAAEFEKRRKIGGRRERLTSESYKPSTELVRNPGKDFKTTIENVTVEIIQGDITKQKTGAIVNSVLKELNLLVGRVSRAILWAAGQAIQTECLTTANHQRMETEGLVVTKPGQLLCQRIIHMKAKSSTQGWEKMICRCLDEVEQLGLNSVTFPALGTGGRGCPPDAMARLMMSSFRHYITSKDYRKCLKSIRIVIYEADMLETFVKSVQESPSLSPRKSIMDIFRPKKEPVSNVTIHVYIDSQSHLEQVKNKLESLYAENKMYLPKLVQEKLDERQMNQIARLGTDKKVNFVFNRKDSCIILQGYGSSIGDVRKDVEAYVIKLEKDYRRETSATSVELPKTWSKMSLKDSPRLEVLSIGGPEFLPIARKFQNEVGKRQIVKIERVQNPALFTQYYAHKQQMEQMNHGSQFPIERCLWHGTSPAAADSINKTGFNRNFNTGASHGAGVYFAVSAGTSLSYCSSDPMGLYHMYYANVLTGDCCVGSAGIRNPPAKLSSQPWNTYDSTTDNVHSPNFFVIFHDSKAYPSYHIVFK